MQDNWIPVVTVIKEGRVMTISDIDNNNSEISDSQPINPKNEWASVLALADFSDGMYEIYGKTDGTDEKKITEIWIRSHRLNSLLHAN